LYHFPTKKATSKSDFPAQNICVILFDFYFQSFAWLEPWHLGRRDFDRLTGPWIDTSALLSLTDIKCPETGQCDLVTSN
jgi:hypothetical protein